MNPHDVGRAIAQELLEADDHYQGRPPYKGMCILTSKTYRFLAANRAADFRVVLNNKIGAGPKRLDSESIISFNDGNPLWKVIETLRSLS